MPSPVALARARRLLEHARADVADLRSRTRALRAETAWQARAADDYRAAIEELSAAFDRIILLLGLAEDDVAALHRAALAGASCR